MWKTMAPIAWLLILLLLSLTRESMRKVIDNAWTLEKTFDLDQEFTHAFLDCEGLDTLASITLNGTVVGSTDNQFRHYQLDITKVLVKKSNILRITFDNAVRISKDRADAYPYYVCPEQQKGMFR